MRIAPVVLVVTALTLGVVGVVSLRPQPAGPSGSGVEPPARATFGGHSRESATGGRSGYGWSVQPKSGQALLEAYQQANPSTEAGEVSFVYYNTQHDPEAIRDALAEKGVTRYLGETTHEGILTPDGYIRSDTGVLGLLTSEFPHMDVGVGGASFEDMDPREGTLAAVERARADAGVEDPDRRPSMIVLCVTVPNEEVVVAALEEATGEGIPMVGGTAAGSVDPVTRKRVKNWSILANGEILSDGVGVALLFADEEFGWAYGGGFHRTAHSGTVTRAEGRVVYEIDGRPAAEVYDAWLGGEVTGAQERGENIVNFCTLHPLCRNNGEHSQSTRVWPSNDHPGALQTGSSLSEGSVVSLGEGTWNILLNHFSSVPGGARRSMKNEDAMAGLFIYCGGALNCIPEIERPQMAPLVGNSMDDLPWIGVFTWGEQGNLPGMGNLHSNLASGTVLFPEAGAR